MRRATCGCCGGRWSSCAGEKLVDRPSKETEQGRHGMKQLTCATPTGGLLRRFPVDEDDDDVSDDSDESDGSDADALKQEKDDFLAYMDDIDRLTGPDRGRRGRSAGPEDAGRKL